MTLKDTKKLMKIATGFRNGILGMEDSKEKCLMVSASLEGLLRFSGYDCTLTEGIVADWFHFWITFPDTTILDPTADQFSKPNGENMPPVYIGGKPKWYKVIKQGVS